MKTVLSIIAVVIAMSIIGMRISKSIAFKQNVKGILKHAADANTIELAKEELTKVITYLEQNDLTTGYTSIVWKTPDEDIDFWYRNLKASLRELEKIGPETTSLEKTNVLIKLRETLLDSGERTRVTYPEGISVYPHNKMWAVLMILAFISMIIGIALIFPDEKTSTSKS